jgi:plasmid stabilization system protein ParE
MRHFLVLKRECDQNRMSGYGLHPEALTDLEEIRDYIASENPDAANRVLIEIFDAIRVLSQFPHTGTCGPTLQLALCVFRSCGSTSSHTHPKRIRSGFSR